jgi:hypothetical protein
MDVLHNLREEGVDVKAFLNSLALKDVVFEVAHSWADVK